MCNIHHQKKQRHYDHLTAHAVIVHRTPIGVHFGPHKNTGNIYKFKNIILWDPVKKSALTNIGKYVF